MQNVNLFYRVRSTVGATISVTKTRIMLSSPPVQYDVGPNIFAHGSGLRMVSFLSLLYSL